MNVYLTFFSIALCSEKPINLLRAALLGAHYRRNGSYQRPVRPATALGTRGSPHVRASTHAGWTHTRFHTSERTHFHTKADTHTQTQTHRAAQEVERGWLVSQRLLVLFPGSSKACRGVPEKDLSPSLLQRSRLSHG